MAGIAHQALLRWGMRPRDVAEMSAEELAFLAASLEMARRAEERGWG